MITDFKPRLYQETILATAAKANTLVALPTGLGKTAIAVMLAAHRLELYPNSKILILAPTRPLVDQLMQSFKAIAKLDDEDVVMFTGHVKPEKRQEMWKSAKIIASTPQGLENDILSRRISLEDVSLLVFDEAHRATGDYAYTFVAKQYNKYAKYERILALTASPGSDLEKITEICENLFIEEIEIRTDEDPDVKPYVQEVDINWVKVELPEEFLAIKKQLEQSFQSKLSEMKKYGFVNSKQTNQYSKKDLLNLQAQLHAQIAQGNKDFEVLKSLSLAAEAMKVQHGLELLETQGIHSLFLYLEKIISQAKTSKVKATQNLGRDIAFKTAFLKTEKLQRENIEHPKLAKLKTIVEEDLKNDDCKIIIFNQYRDSATRIVKEMETIDGCSVRLFVGQQKKGETGMTQKKQLETLQEFREGVFNTIVMTSVGEEGLDIPSVDHVIFYEPIPSAIRHIQRRGRTGRLEKGKVTILLAKNTRDEGYRWSAYYKEKRMHRTLHDIKKKMKLNGIDKRQQTLESYNGLTEEQKKENEQIKIYVDPREKGSPVMKELLEMNAGIELNSMQCGDYLLSHRCAVEMKLVPDFVDSIIDGRLIEQMGNLKRNYDRPIVIIEGIEDIYTIRKVHTNAIQGMMATIAVSYGIPIIQTRNFRESANLLLIIAKREQKETGKNFSPHSEKRTATLKDQQEYVVSSLPGVGIKHAKELLKKFGSVKKVINAKEEKLKDVELIGNKKAKAIKDVTDSEYEEQ